MESPAISESLEEGSPSPTVQASQKGNWVRAVQGVQKGLKKYDVSISMKDGVGSINVPEEVIKEASPLWEDFIMGKFLDKAPHVAKVHAIVNKIWSMGDKTQMIDVFVINSNTMKFRVTNMAARTRILRRCMWNLAGIPVVMSKWTPFIEEDQPEEKSIPLWVHLKNVPTNMVSWQGLSFITSPIGSPIRLHPETAQCINIHTPKIFVNADLTKELPKKLIFNLLGKEVLVEYSYPWVPPRCTNCMKWGHLEKACLAPRKILQQTEEEEDGKIQSELAKNKENSSGDEQVENLTGEIHRLNQSETELEEGQIIEKTAESSRARVEEALVVTETELIKKSGEKTDEVEREEEKEEERWLDVTPGKASRSPNKKQVEMEHSSILSNSRFSVLSSTEDNEEDGSADSVETDEAGNSGANEELEGAEVNQQIEENKKENVVTIARQSLPRVSKDKHKFLSESAALKAKETAPAQSKKTNRKKY